MRAEFWRENLQERDQLKNPGVDGYSKSGMRGHGLSISGSEKGHVAGRCECSNKKRKIS